MMIPNLDNILYLLIKFNSIFLLSNKILKKINFLIFLYINKIFYLYMIIINIYFF